MKIRKYKGYKRKGYTPKIYKGIKFDSKVEIKYYKYLEEQLKKGDIKSFTYHPESITYCDFTSRQTKKHIKHSYTTDFEVIDKNDKKIWIDTKGGFSPAEWKIRRDFILNYLNSHRLDIDMFKELSFYKDEWTDVNDILVAKKQYRKDKLNIVKYTTKEFKDFSKTFTKNKTKTLIKDNIKYILGIKNKKEILYYRGKRYKQKVNIIKTIAKEVNKYEKAKRAETKKRLKKEIINKIYEFSGLKYKAI